IITPASPGEAWPIGMKVIIVLRDKHIGSRLRSGGEIWLWRARIFVARAAPQGSPRSPPIRDMDHASSRTIRDGEEGPGEIQQGETEEETRCHEGGRESQEGGSRESEESREESVKEGSAEEEGR